MVKPSALRIGCAPAKKDSIPLSATRRMGFVGRRVWEPSVHAWYWAGVTVWYPWLTR